MTSAPRRAKLVGVTGRFGWNAREYVAPDLGKGGGKARIGGGTEHATMPGAPKTFMKNNKVGL